MSHQQSDLTGLAVDAIGMRLLRAAEIIRERGWCQRTFTDDIGRVCAMGAIDAACPGHSDYYEGCRRMEERFGTAIPAWNDAPGRTADEVIDALTAAALSHAAQG